MGLRQLLQLPVQRLRLKPSGPLTAAGVPAVSAAAMIHVGATVLDSLPHGSFFHATGGSVFI